MPARPAPARRPAPRRAAPGPAPEGQPAGITVLSPRRPGARAAAPPSPEAAGALAGEPGDGAAVDAAGGEPLAGEPLSERGPASGRSTLPPPTRETRTFTQERARTTYQALLGAAARVFVERGYDDTQTPDIAAAAGVSVGTFYRYFADKRQVFIEMIERHLTLAFERVIAELVPEHFAPARTRAARRETVERVVGIIFAHAASQPELHRVLLGVALRDPEVRRLRDEFDARGRAALVALIEQVVPRSRIPDAEAAARMLQIAVQDVAMMTTGGFGGEPLPPEQGQALRSALTDMVMRYAFAE